MSYQLPPPHKSLEEEINGAIIESNSTNGILKDLGRLACRTTIWAYNSEEASGELRASTSALHIPDKGEEEDQGSSTGNNVNVLPVPFLELRKSGIIERHNSFVKKSVGEHTTTLDDLVSEDAISTKKASEAELEEVKSSETERVILMLSQELEDIDVHEKVYNQIQKSKSKGKFNLEVFLDSNVLATTSPTIRLLRTIGQNVILIGAYHLKYHLTQEIITKDVFGPTGWQILINIYQNSISVVHMKREQSLPAQGTDNFFSFEWHLTMHFDKHMAKIHASNIKIADFWVSKSMEQKQKDLLERKFCNGNLIVC